MRNIEGTSLDNAFANAPMLSSHDGRLDVDLVAAPGSCTIDAHPIKIDEVLLGTGRRGDRFRRVRKTDTPLLARCTAPRSSASTIAVAALIELLSGGFAPPPLWD